MGASISRIGNTHRTHKRITIVVHAAVCAVDVWQQGIAQIDIAVYHIEVALPFLAKLIDGTIGCRAVTAHDGTERTELNPATIEFVVGILSRSLEITIEETAYIAVPSGDAASRVVQGSRNLIR